MDRLQRMVYNFHVGCGLPHPARITLDDFPAELRIRLIYEEADEFAKAVVEQDLVEMIDALCDLLYVTYGAAVCLGVDLEPFFEEVHRSNMDKVGAPKRADGKQLKPANWMPPRIRKLLMDQLAREDTMPDGGCYTLANGECVAPNCHLHNPIKVEPKPKTSEPSSLRQSIHDLMRRAAMAKYVADQHRTCESKCDAPRLISMILDGKMEVRKPDGGTIDDGVC